MRTLACESRECMHWKFDIVNNCDAFPVDCNLVLIQGKCPGYKEKSKQMTKFDTVTIEQMVKSNNQETYFYGLLAKRINEIIDWINCDEKSIATKPAPIEIGKLDPLAVGLRAPMDPDVIMWLQSIIGLQNELIDAVNKLQNNQQRLENNILRLLWNKT